jgi:hypothetical protein
MPPIDPPIARLPARQHAAGIGINRKPTVEQAVDSIRNACRDFPPEAVVTCTVAAQSALADGAASDPDAADAVAAIRKSTDGASPVAYRATTVEVLTALKDAIDKAAPPATVAE